MKTKRVYECDICSTQYNNKNDALQCEKDHPVMLCPECKEPMECTIKSNYNCYFDSDECSTPPTYTYTCKKCKISYEKDGYKETWEMTSGHQPTTKQHKAVLFICRELNIQQPPPTKKSYWEFIGKYMNKAKESKEINYDYDYGYNYFDEQF